MRFLPLLLLLATLSSCGTAPAFARHTHHAPVQASFWSFPSDLVATARSQLGNGPVYGRATLWCARFMNYVLERTGHRGTGSDLARSFLALPHVAGPAVGAIAVLGRRGGGHVGVVSGVTARGDVVLISGNSAGRVREGVVSRRRVLAFVKAR